MLFSLLFLIFTLFYFGPSCVHILWQSKCAESLKTKITENAVEGVKKDAKSIIPDNITEDPRYD